MVKENRCNLSIIIPDITLPTAPPIALHVNITASTSIPTPRCSAKSSKVGPNTNKAAPCIDKCTFIHVCMYVHPKQSHNSIYELYIKWQFFKVNLGILNSDTIDYISRPHFMVSKYN